MRGKWRDLIDRCRASRIAPEPYSPRALREAETRSRPQPPGRHVVIDYTIADRIAREDCLPVPVVRATLAWYELRRRDVRSVSFR